jgi:hypothetical protein
VARNGSSENDLDIALSSVTPESLENALARFDREVMPRLDAARVSGPHEAVDPAHGWFMNVLLVGGRTVEFYFPAADFPLTDEPDGGTFRCRNRLVVVDLS